MVGGASCQEQAVAIEYLLIISPLYCRQYSVEYKLETYLKIARLYLENDDSVQAEAYINRASLLQVRKDIFQICHALVVGPVFIIAA